MSEQSTERVLCEVEDGSIRAVDADATLYIPIYHVTRENLGSPENAMYFRALESIWDYEADQRAGFDIDV